MMPAVAQSAAPAQNINCPGTRIAMWSEWVPFPRVREMLPLLKKNNLDLYLAIDPEDIGSRELAGLLTTARRKGIQVRAWPLLSYDDGYWPSESNAQKYSDQVIRLLDWLRSERLPVDWIEVDMEFTWQEMAELKKYFADQDWLGLIKFFDRTIDKQKFDAAVTIYRGLVDEIHRRGLKVACVTFPFVMDDLPDGKNALQDAIDMPVTPVAWDEISFMAYRTIFQELLGEEYGPWLVYGYSQSAKKYFGAKAGIDLGVTTMEGAPNGFYFPAELRKDVQAVKAAGLGNVHVYSLDTLAEDANPERWVEGLAQLPPQAPAWNPKVTVLRGVLQLIDAVLGKIWGQ